VLISAAPVKRFSPANRLRKKAVIALLFAELNRIEKTFLQASHLLKVFFWRRFVDFGGIKSFPKGAERARQSKRFKPTKAKPERKTGGGERKSFRKVKRKAAGRMTTGHD